VADAGVLIPGRNQLRILERCMGVKYWWKAKDPSTCRLKNTAAGVIRMQGAEMLLNRNSPSSEEEDLWSSAIAN